MNTTGATSRQNLDRLMGRMEALSEPTRLRLLRLLERNELGVAELCEIVQLPQSTVSRHLKVLLDTGWIGNRRQGTSNLYRIEPELDPGARALWRVVREESSRWATARQDQLRLARRLEERRQKSRTFFAGAAGTWDALRHELYGDSFVSAALFALIPAEWTVADLGCGTGHVTAALAPHVGRVIGIDSSDAMLAAARRRTAGLDNVTLQDGELESLPLENDACDAALMVLTLTYVPEPTAALAELSRVLRPGGRAVIVDLLPHDRDDFRRQLGQHWSGFEPDDLTTLLTDAGLEDARARALPPEPNTKGPALFLATARKRSNS